MSGTRLASKVALITGAAGGLGAEIAHRFRDEGATVFVTDVSNTPGEETAAAIGAIYLHLDVTSEENWKSVLAAIVARCGQLNVLVNNAGINIRKNIEEMPVESFDAMLAVNIRGPFLGIKHALPIMRAAGGGVILNMSSVCGLIGHRYTNETYTTTKGALTLLTKSIATRYAKDNIRCVSLHPSTVETAFVQTLLKDPDRRAERLREVPLGRLASPTDVANAALFLASDEASFINGVAFAVDGGATAG